MDKVIASAAEAIADIKDGALLAVGGFGLCGVPQDLIDALHEKDTKDLTVVTNNCGIDGDGLGILLPDHKISRVIASYVGENKEFARQYLSGELELELTPQGTLAERLRAGGVGIPGFYTITGAGTAVADGGIPTRYNTKGDVIKTSEPKPTRDFNGVEYVLEEAIVSDFALVHALKADRHGNVVFNKAARNFNAPVAMSGKITIVEAEEIVEAGEIDPDAVHLPGIFVHRVVQSTARKAKACEQRNGSVTPWHGLAIRWQRAPRESLRTVSTSTSASVCRRWCRASCRREGASYCRVKTASLALVRIHTKAKRIPT